MGVGKSSIGRRVARELGYQFIDSDQQIEKEQGARITEIFAAHGETYFRKLERQFIEDGHPDSGCVISCGGGLVIQDGMKEVLRAKGVVICLFASIESILERTRRNKNRPLLDVDDQEAEIKMLLKEREPIYMSCGASISTDQRSLSDVTRHLVHTYKSNARAHNS